MDATAGADGTGDGGDETGRGGGGGARGCGAATVVGTARWMASRSGGQQATAPSERTTTDGDAVDMECDDGGGGGAGSSGGRQAAWELGFDVDELEVRAAQATSARLAAQASEQGRVKKKKLTRRGKGRSHDERNAAAATRRNDGAPR